MISTMKWMVGLAMFAMVGLVRAPLSEAEEQASQWTPVGDLEGGWFDTRHSDVLWKGDGTYLNWRINQFLGANGPVGRLLCGPSGWVFSETQRMKVGLPAPEMIAHPVTHTSLDTTQRVYSFRKGEGLWMSDNAGASWWNRGYRFGNSLADVAVSAADSWIIYALVIEPSADTDVVDYSIYGSTNTGLIWTKRMTSRIPVVAGLAPRLSLRTLLSRKASVEQVILTIEQAGPTRQICHYISRNGGRSWASAHNVQTATSMDFYQTDAGLMRLQTPGSINLAGQTTLYALDLSTDGGATWSPLPAPSNDGYPSNGFSIPKIALWPHPTIPNMVLIQDNRGLWYSADNGYSWHKIAEPFEYAPDGVLGFGLGLPTSIFRRNNDGSFAVFEL